ncbi:MAG: cyclic pyranopterin monophosphate synthase [Fimbriimonadales bacterium]
MPGGDELASSGRNIAERSPLTDRFGRVHSYLRISVTDRCNFRCVYCMPPEGIEWRCREELLTFEEIVRLARVFVRLGVDKVRLTGGEPTVRRGIESLLSALAGLPGLHTLAMTTNGFRLREQARIYREAGLTNINVSLDSLRRDRFEQITRRDALDDVLAGLDAALSVGFRKVKINTVVMAGVNDDELLDFVDLARDRPLHVRFIEFMPFHNNGWSVGGVFPLARMREVIGGRYSLEPVRAEPNAVAREWRIPGFEGTIGFIASMTESFCSECNRIRLTADGQIKSCLFSPAESNLRDVLRTGASDDELEARIRTALWLKPKEHPPMEVLAAQENRSMIEIGG